MQIICRNFTIAGILMLILTACGGGGGGGGSTSQIPSLPSGNPANSLLASDNLFVQPAVAREEASCSGGSCTLTLGAIQSSKSLSDFGEVTFGGGTGDKTLNGVALDRDADSQIDIYAGWLNHNFFSALKFDSFINGVHIELSYSLSIGDATNTNPTPVGSETTTGSWTGAMVGTDVSENDTYGNMIEGKAGITLTDFNNPSVNVSFTEIVDVDDGDSARSDMAWLNISVTNGRFKTGSNLDSIDGKFYGPNHEEVGGIFERDEILGAFGALRE